MTRENNSFREKMSAANCWCVTKFNDQIEHDEYTLRENRLETKFKKI